MLMAKIVIRIWFTRLNFLAPRFCPTMVEPAVVKDWEITPHMILTLLKMPVRAEYVTSNILIQDVSMILEKLMAADWIAMGMPRARSRRKAFPSILKEAGLKSNPKLSRRQYR